jgi:uncharacterized coiled-coil DUF342 family protein
MAKNIKFKVKQGMSFKRLTKDEIKYTINDSIIGVPYFRNESIENESKGKLHLQKKAAAAVEENHSDLEMKQGKKIPIVLERNQQFELAADGTQLGFKQEKWIQLNNPSMGTKIWNLHLEVENNDQQFDLVELKPSTEYRERIEEHVKDAPSPLEIVEKISRSDYPSSLEYQNELYLDKQGNNTVFVALFITNRSETALKNIDLIKNLPENAIKVSDAKATAGKIHVERAKIRFVLDRLLSGQSITCTFKIQIPPVSTRFGTIQCYFQVEPKEADQDFVRNFKASTKVAQFLNVYEQEERPGVWDCSLVVINRSDLLVEIRDVELIHKKGDDQTTVFKDQLNRISKPFEEITVHKTTIEEQVQPNLTKNIVTVPLYQFTRNYLCNLTVSENRLELLDLSGEKLFSVNQIRSFESAHFECTVALKNQSSIALNHLFFHETLPADFSIGDLSKIEININEKSLTLGEYQKDIKHGTTQEEIAYLLLEIAKCDEAIAKIVQNRDAVNKEYGRLTDLQIDANIARLKSEKKQLLTSIEQFTASLKTCEKESIDLEKKVRTLNDQKKAAETIFEAINAQNSALSEINSLESQIETEKSALGTVKAQVKKLTDEIAALKAAPKPEGDTGAIDKQIADLEKQLSLAQSQEQQLSQKIIDMETQITAKKAAVPKGETMNGLSKKIIDEKAKVDNITQALNETTQKLTAIQAQMTQIRNSLAQASDSLAAIDQNLTTNEENAKKLAEITRELEKLETDYDHMNNLRETYQNRKVKLERLSDKHKSVDEITEFIRNDFKTGISKVDYTNFEAFFLQGEDKRAILYILINNLSSVLEECAPNETFHLKYEITTSKPRNDVDYKFPTVIYYDTDPPKAVQKYEIAGDFLPNMRILHERRKISLGKIIDSFEEAGKFSVTLLVKNNGNTDIPKIKVLDQLPQTASISNTFYQFEEKPIGGNMKQIIWQITEIKAFQEKEVTYLVDLNGNQYDLNDFELRFEE